MICTGEVTIYVAKGEDVLIDDVEGRFSCTLGASGFIASNTSITGGNGSHSICTSSRASSAI